VVLFTLMKIYHYASPDSWRDVKEGSWQSRDEPGLGACLRVCKDNFEDEGARDGAVFGLLEPEPDSWVNSAEFPVAWRNLVVHTGRLLLAYEPTDEIIAQSFVIDWSHRERSLGGHRDDLGKGRRKEATRQARVASEKAYWASRVPLADCIDRPEVIAEHALPEVITMCTVPFDLLEIAGQQPRLHDLSPPAKENLLRAIEYNPDLKALATLVT
jgi:hypothetical protein